MGIEYFIGHPPQRIKNWIKQNFTPANTIIIYNDGTPTKVVECSDGTLTWQMTKGGSYSSRNTTIKEVYIGKDVTSIGDDAFCICTHLSSVTIPSSVTSIGDSAFNWCSVTSVTIPSSVTSIREYAFDHCTALTTCTIPPSVTSIGRAAFSACPNLKIVVDESNPNYTSQDGSLFNKEMSILIHGSGGVTSYTIPSSVTSIGDFAFYEYTALTSVTIPEGVTEIGFGAFRDCWGLTSITIPSSVTSIGDWALAFCDSLTSVTIPEGVTSIGEYAFNGCLGFPTDANGAQYESEDKIVLIDVPSSLTGEFIVPDSVRFICSNVFEYCSKLTSVEIPSSVTSIGRQAFYGCSGLTSITIPSSVTSIGMETFAHCSGLTSIDFSEHNTPPTLASTNAIPYTNTGFVIYVKAGTLSAWQTATNWSDMSSVFQVKA